MAVQTKEIKLTPMEQNMAKLEQEKKKLVPTPPVGTLVQWHRRGDRENVSAAIVTRVEGVGRVCLTIFPPNGMAEHVTGCLHVSNPIHDRRNNHQTQTKGSWEYPEGYKVPSEHKEVHKEEIERKLNSYGKQLDQAKQVKKAQEPESQPLTKE